MRKDAKAEGAAKAGNGGGGGAKGAKDPAAKPAAQPAARRGGSSALASAVITAVLVALVGCGVAVMVNSPKARQAVVDFVPKPVVFWLEDLTGMSVSVTSGFQADKQLRRAQDDKPEVPVKFTVHFNGDGLSEGEAADSAQYAGLDALIRKACQRMPEVRAIAKEDPVTFKRICDPEQGARLFDEHGRRIFSFHDIKEGGRTYLVPQGLHFMWPLGEVGSLHYPLAIESPVPERPVRLRQLSMSPRVFTVENFMSQDEMQAILDHNKDLVKPSEVGFSGWRDSTRTSWTAWDFHSWAARKVQRRSFDLLGMEFDQSMADATQVLRYNLTEWYKPHTDWFDGKAYDGHDPTEHNGTNRFATVFLYLTDVEEGGHTVFPLSKTHETYDGSQLVAPGTEKTPGYIAQKDAEWVCNTSSTALRSEPKAGNAVLFYSQTPEGALDALSLHGGCPVIKGLKWSANVWIWNRPKPSKSKAKDGKPDQDDKSIGMRFHNKRDGAVSLFWDDGTDEMVFQLEIAPDEYKPMTTYHSHRFVAKDKESGERVFEFVAKDEYKGKDYVAEIV